MSSLLRLPRKLRFLRPWLGGLGIGVPLPLAKVNVISWVGLGKYNCPDLDIGHMTALITETCGPQHVTFPGTLTWLLLAFFSLRHLPFVNISLLPPPFLLPRLFSSCAATFLFTCEAAHYLATFTVRPASCWAVKLAVKPSAAPVIAVTSTTAVSAASFSV